MSRLLEPPVPTAVPTDAAIGSDAGETGAGCLVMMTEDAKFRAWLSRALEALARRRS